MFSASTWVFLIKSRAHGVSGLIIMGQQEKFGTVLYLDHELVVQLAQGQPQDFKPGQ